jgi:hypothetical protein
MNLTAIGIGTGVGFGAAMMYLFDRDMGKRRRALLRDKAVRAGKDSASFARKGARDLAHRAKGAVYESKHLLSQEEVSDEVLVDRVRSALGRASQHPRSIEVTADNGVVIVRGPVLRQDQKRILSYVRNVRGVTEVQDELDPYDEAADVPGLQGGSSRRDVPELLQRNWAPAYRLIAGGLGAGLLVYGLRRGGYSAMPAGLSGAALLLGGVTNKTWKGLFGGAEET